MKPENIEFSALWSASGWSKAETARRLELDRSSIGKFLAGDISPSAQTLKLFKLILADESPGTLTGATLRHGELHEGEYAQSEWEKSLFAELRDLHIEDRQRVLNAVKAFVAGLPKRSPVQYEKPQRLTEAQQIVKQAGEKYDAQKKANLDRERRLGTAHREILRIVRGDPPKSSGA